MATEEKFYNQWCKPQFEDIQSSQKEILRLLRGKNGDPGLIDDVRDNTRFRTRILWGFGLVVTAVITQAVVWIKSKI